MKRQVYSNLADLPPGSGIWWSRGELTLRQIRWQIYPPVAPSSGQEWQYDISTVRAHIGRSTGRSNPPVLLSSGQKWQYDISTIRAHIGRSTGRFMPPPDN